MGRKKRKVVDDAPSANTLQPIPPQAVDLPGPPAAKTLLEKEGPAVIGTEETNDDAKKASSGYAMTSHGAEIVDEDIYISDGSEDDDDEPEIEMLLANSRMGVMRRGIHHQMLVQPNRQWTRKEQQAEGTAVEDEDAEQKRLKEQEEELAKLDPAQRAARLLVEKQRKLEEAKENARHLESEENAGRDPCLFSKRTAFDIRFDQIDDKPWTRADPTDFFNYSLTEEDWIEYAQQQLMIRQELTDASRQRRAPDPTLVPVTPRAPSQQQPKVAVAAPGEAEGVEGELQINEGAGKANAPVVGPVLVKKEPVKAERAEGPPQRAAKLDVHVGAGGAWGAGAAPGSVLAKLIEDQERKEAAGSTSVNSLDGSRAHDDSGDSVANSRFGGNRSSRGGQESRGWNQETPHNHQSWKDQQQQQRHHHPNQYHPNNQNENWGGGQPDRDSRGSFKQQPRWEQRDPQGGRGYHGGRGGREGRGGGGGRFQYSDHGGQGHRGNFGGGSDFHGKRPREDYDNPSNKRWRR